MTRIGAAAAPRWWGMDPSRYPVYLDHLTALGATSVELIVHHGVATRDPSTVHLDRQHWATALSEASRRGIHVDIHNSLDPRFRLGRWAEDRFALLADLRQILDFLVQIEQLQSAPPVFVVHAADDVGDGEAISEAVLRWMTDHLARRGSAAVICVELRAAHGPSDHRFDRDRDRLSAFVDRQQDASIGMCWDVANDWLTSARSGTAYVPPSSVPPTLRHVHLHGSTADGSLHAPLGDGTVPWEAALTLLRDTAWAGSVTLEIRYRLAHEVGDPWSVLAESVRRAIDVRK